MTTIETRETVLLEVPRTLVRWGAVFAGLAFLLGLSWLLFLFGSALGVSIADASDLGAEGLGIGAIVWLLVTVLVAYFCGGLLAGRLAGSADHSTGMLHGLTLWGAATAAMLLLGYWGLASMIAAGQSLAAGAWRAGSAAATAAESEGGAAGAGESSPFFSEIQAALKTRVSAALAEASPEVTEPEARQAIEQVDSATLAAAVREWIVAGPEAAKQVLARETTLSEGELDSIVADVGAEGGEQLAALRASAGQSVETISDYTAGTLWGFFALTVLALLACIGGGWVGADLVRRYLAAQARSARVPG